MKTLLEFELPHIMSTALLGTHDAWADGRAFGWPYVCAVVVPARSSRCKRPRDSSLVTAHPL